MSSVGRAGVRILDCEGQFQIDNFRESCTFTTFTNRPGFLDDRAIYAIRSGRILGVGNYEFGVTVSWCVEKGTTDICEASNFGIHLRRIDDGKDDLVAKCDVELINADASRSLKATINYKGMSANCERGWGPRNPNLKHFLGLKLDQVFKAENGWLHDGTLKIACKLSVLFDDQSCTAETTKPSLHVEACNDLGALFASQAHADLTINILGKEIRAHSQVLIARSPVFAAMFSSHMKESQDRRVEVGEDLDGEAMNSMIQFLYTANIDPEILNSDSAALNVMKAAHRYQVNSLVTMCVQSLTTRLDIETVSDWLQIAELISCDSFKAACLDFIRSHIADVQATESYAALASKCPSLLAEILAMLFPPAKRQRTGEANTEIAK